MAMSVGKDGVASGPELGRRILAMHDILTEEVVVPEWDSVKIEVRSMTGRERAGMLRDAMDKETGEVDYERMFPFIVIACAFSPDTGEPLFSEADIPALNTKNARAVQRVAEVGMRLSGLSQETEAERAESFPDGSGGGA